MAIQVDEVSANEIRTSSLQAHTQIMNEMLSFANHATGLLKVVSTKLVNELGAVESASNERLLNAPPRP